MTVAESGWSVVGASARGSRHARLDQPNQDALEWATVTGRDEQITVVAVADGHGGDRYVRSDVGSRRAVEIAVDETRRVLGASGLPPRRKLEQWARHVLAPAVVGAWRVACESDLAAQPFTADERSRVDEPLDVEPLLAYGSTLLLAVLGERGATILQLGDGDCVAVGADGTSVAPMPGDARLVAGETTSLCLPEAIDDFRVAVDDGGRWDVVLLGTDGYGVAFVDPSWREVVGRDVRDQLAQHGPGHLQQMLPHWLAEAAEVGGDDATVAVAFRPASGTTVGSNRVPRRRSRRRPVAIAIGPLVIGAVAWGILALPSPDEPGPSAAAATPATVDVAPSPPSPPSPAATQPSTTTTAMPGVRILAGQGWVVEVDHGATDSRARLVAGPDEAPNRSIDHGGQTWHIVNGVLTSSRTATALSTDPTLSVRAVAFSDGRLWAVSEDLAWVLTVNLSESEPCLVLAVDRSDADGAARASTPTCHLEGTNVDSAVGGSTNAGE